MAAFNDSSSTRSDRREVAAVGSMTPQGHGGVDPELWNADWRQWLMGQRTYKCTTRWPFHVNMDGSKLRECRLIADRGNGGKILE